MKWAFTVLCVCIIAICVSGQPYQAPASKAKESHPKGQQTPPAPVHNQITDNQTKNAPNDAPKWYASPEWFLVGVGIITFGVLCFQSVQTKKAAEAAKNSAEAANKNANALINSERAWIMVDVRFGRSHGLLHETPGAWGTEATSAELVVTLKNSGPTPAWVYEQFACLWVTDEIIQSAQFYPSPKFPFAMRGMGHKNYGIYPISRGDDDVTWAATVSHEGWATPENGLYVYVFGVTWYRDAFNAFRETYWGYVVTDTRALRRIPNEAYNKHT
jgi:hypothetical protein